jgi:prevent-host-death family protein
MYSMITVTATQAARNFANLLDAVEHGETVVVTRDGVPVGRFAPERRTSAERLKAALLEYPADAGFADDLAVIHADLRSAFSNEVPEWPDE